MLVEKIAWIVPGASSGGHGHTDVLTIFVEFRRTIAEGGGGDGDNWCANNGGFISSIGIFCVDC